LAHAVFECAFGRFAGHFQDAAVSVEKPTVITTAQSAVLDVAELEGRAAVRTTKREQSRLSLVVAIEHEIFAEKPASDRPIFELIREPDRMPVTPKHFTAWHAAPNLRQGLIFFDGQRHKYLSRDTQKEAICSRKISDSRSDCQSGSGRVNRLLKKAHLLRCAQSPRSSVSVNTPPLVDFSRASHVDLFEQPGIRVFQRPVK
jgi:hypothetical protein